MAKILLIDDDDGFRLMIKTALEREGHTVFEALNGKRGYEIFFEHPCDLIVTDIFMPEQEGIHTIFDFKSDFPDIPVIAISGGGSMANRQVKDNLLAMVNSKLDAVGILELAADFGADFTFSKPICLDNFLYIINDLFQEVGA